MNTIRIKTSLWALQSVRKASSYLTRSDGSTTIGMADNGSKVIYVQAGLSADRFRQVVCHEIVHAICFEYDISLPIETEELIADFVGTHFDEIQNAVDQAERIARISH